MSAISTAMMVTEWQPTLLASLASIYQQSLWPGPVWVFDYTERPCPWPFERDQVLQMGTLVSVRTNWVTRPRVGIVEGFKAIVNTVQSSWVWLTVDDAFYLPSALSLLTKAADSNKDASSVMGNKIDVSDQRGYPDFSRHVENRPFAPCSEFIIEEREHIDLSHAIIRVDVARQHWTNATMDPDVPPGDDYLLSAMLPGVHLWHSQATAYHFDRARDHRRDSIRFHARIAEAQKQRGEILRTQSLLYIDPSDPTNSMSGEE